MISSFDRLAGQNRGAGSSVAMGMFRPAPVILSTALVLAAMSRPAEACSCARPSIAAGAARADAVFAGRIVATTVTPVDPAACKKKPAWCVKSYRYTIAVDNVWKGDVPANVEVDAGHGRGDCSFGKMTAERWLVMASGPLDHLTVRLCSGTRPATTRALAQAVSAIGTGSVP